MLSSLRAAIRRRGGRTVSPGADHRVLAQVRDHLDPVLVPAGFTFADVSTTGARAFPTTLVRYLADPVATTSRFPRLAGHLRAEGESLALEVTRQGDRVGVEVEGFGLDALLAAVRAGPGAPPRRRHLPSGPGAGPEPGAGSEPGDALAQAADLLRRLFDGERSDP